MARRKLSLKFNDWPAGDRRAFSAALDEIDEGNDIGLAAFWSKDWREAVIKRYGMWLHFLQRNGWLDPGSSPLARVTKERLRSFVKEIDDRVESETTAAYALGMSEALRVMCPNEKRPKYLKKAVRKLARLAQPSRDDRSKLVAPYQLYRAGLRRMKRYQAAAATCPKSALKFMDGLMMAMIVSKALRMKNFAGMLWNKNIKKNPLDMYEVKFAKIETKNHVRIRAELPRTLTKYIDFYVTIVRDKLLQKRESEAMWITSINTDMAPITLYYRFCAATFEELEKRINPHMVRKIVATGVAFAEPTAVSITPALLDHNNSRTQKEAYNLAGNIAGSAVHIRLLEIRRRRAIDGDET
jgi:predicted secreted protein